MIWGDTYKESSEKQILKELEKNKKNTIGFYKFIWFPTTLYDGRWVWLETVYMKLENKPYYTRSDYDWILTKEKDNEIDTRRF